MEQYPPRNVACGRPDPDRGSSGMPIVRHSPSGPLGPRRLWPVLAAVVALAAPAPAADAPRRVLILYADRHDLPMNQVLDPKLRANFRAGLGDRAEVYSEHINAASFP